MISVFCHHRWLQPWGASSSCQPSSKYDSVQPRRKPGTFLCAFRKRQPWSIASLNVIKVLINIHVQHLYSEYLIISLQERSRERRGEEEKTISSVPKRSRQQEMQTCAQVIYKLVSTKPRNLQKKKFFSGWFSFFHYIWSYTIVCRY